MDEIGSFFSGGGKTAKFPTIGTEVRGTITAIHPPEDQTNLKGEVVKDKNGNPKKQVRINLATDLRDPDSPDDDGNRTLYVKGWMTGAIGLAVRHSGAKAPEVGGFLSVTFSEEEPSTTPGFDPTKKYTATYRPPASPGAASIMDTPSGLTRPAGFDAATWAAMDDSARRGVVAAMSGREDDKPPF
ncbi:hypothetical protein [Mycobacteroides abscessus]|uniref:hypothetical protein n=1 Tax=Mycobacteroides abscessus TaxID=36809 RepID=UPI0009280080|nr:hypothetical protein [Mycobacteroides abscessus]SKS27770.1 Uncharacterised protein [Mycobacteroides abscessus subsp. abscessus]SHU54827.1 Uncharacterised protein [Mycobacteroides abscessus subsp. bolletii]SHW63431.1 Uncharacterised protein [Mycobacteroides abscessus subsp. bolletii]SHW91496.1 Uncharacterised protein [Mycobacteroides abscessus subsp. bolletii]SHX33670.1 Uncharacterised protein [Mycobacteroides abscessus subsp. bolletii]